MIAEAPAARLRSAAEKVLTMAAFPPAVAEPLAAMLREEAAVYEDPYRIFNDATTAAGRPLPLALADALNALS